MVNGCCAVTDVISNTRNEPALALLLTLTGARQAP